MEFSLRFIGQLKSEKSLLALYKKLFSKKAILSIENLDLKLNDFPERVKTDEDGLGSLACSFENSEFINFLKNEKKDIFGCFNAGYVTEDHEEIKTLAIETVKHTDVWKLSFGKAEEDLRIFSELHIPSEYLDVFLPHWIQLVSRELADKIQAHVPVKELYTGENGVLIQLTESPTDYFDKDHREKMIALYEGLFPEVKIDRENLRTVKTA